MTEAVHERIAHYGCKKPFPFLRRGIVSRWMTTKEKPHPVLSDIPQYGSVSDILPLKIPPTCLKKGDLIFPFSSLLYNYVATNSESISEGALSWTSDRVSPLRWRIPPTIANKAFTLRVRHISTSCCTLVVDIRRIIAS